MCRKELGPSNPVTGGNKVDLWGEMHSIVRCSSGQVLLYCFATIPLNVEEEDLSVSLKGK